MNLAEERQTKLDRIAAYLDSHGLDGVLLSLRSNFCWATGGAHNHVAQPTAVGCFPLLVTKDGPAVIVDNIEAPRIQDEMAWDAVDYQVYPFFSDGGQAAAIAKAVGSGKVATDAPITGVGLPTLGPDFDALRFVLTDSEIEKHRVLSADASIALETACKAIQPGETEMDIAAMLMASAKSKNVEPLVALVASDENVRKYRHPLPTLKPVEKLFMVVLCGERHGLITSHTRLVSFGPLDDDLAARHRAVATVDVAFQAATTPGATLGEALAEGQAAYAEMGFDGEWQKHHQGGLAGYNCREVVARPGDATPIQVNEVFAWNPSITGTKSEDQSLLTASGIEFLKADTDWPQVEVEWKGTTMERPDILVR